MTIDEVKTAADVLGGDRWKIWMKCGLHDWQALPQTDSDEYYCPQCYTLWTADGAIKNIPDRLAP